MTNEQILKKAINKACLNGFTFNVPDKPEWDILSKEEINLKEIEWYIHRYCLEQIIFTHAFAKAFFPKHSKEEKRILKELKILPRWKTCLQQMVLEENPIKYLEKFM